MRQDEHAIGLVMTIVLGVLGLVAVLAAVGGVLYASDFGIEATVIDKSCGSSGIFGGGGPGEVTVETKMFGIEHTLQDVPWDQCNAVQRGNFAVYHVRSGHTTLYASEGGRCIYDSEAGPVC